MKTKFENVVGEIRNEISINMKEIKDEVQECKRIVNLDDKIMKKKFLELELQNHVLQTRLNRSDIVITDLSSDLKNINETIICLCAKLNVDVTIF